ncbi:hypothetical protein [Pediococcus parvulus]|uniref:hypothetical protein n=1 Tax=Pediococcus parvulus TaxID=54062 RepID=UPI0021A5FDE1|nr:hypothetical protein [Pediococcus parvulus]MCT3030279.1 hypothetical protein [Pediococcus parvulus]
MKRKTLVISVAVVVCALIVGFLAIDFSGSTDGAKKFLNKYPIATVATGLNIRGRIGLERTML